MDTRSLTLCENRADSCGHFDAVLPAPKLEHHEAEKPLGVGAPLALAVEQALDDPPIEPDLGRIEQHLAKVVAPASRLQPGRQRDRKALLASAIEGRRKNACRQPLQENFALPRCHLEARRHLPESK